ncbi:glycosyltransferase family 25 protein [Acidaminococcus massiliensis]|jgi:glycosyl transferase family 25|uniref:glycosyltransferase family 25 protein n=1 Tax=Acidaminococcus massiliensis TaxID=1852375 RepID=UPI0022E255B9|nr:glycosyltransferase family 25 protein [Acidaminococcus massiliensis]
MMDFFHYVISAEQATERRNKIIEHFKRWGIEPNFFQAIMGNQLSENQLKQLTQDEGLLTKGEIGCALSHLGTYRRLLETEEKCAFIFEDDTCLTEEFIAVQPKIYHFMAEQTMPSVLLLYPIRGHKKKLLTIGRDISIMRCLAGSGAYAYVLNRQAAINLLRAQTPVKIEMDAWGIYQRMGFVDLYCLNKPVILLDKVLNDNSIIDKISDRRAIDRNNASFLKKRIVKSWYDHFTIQEKMKFYKRRISRHIKELYYDDNEK